MKKWIISALYLCWIVGTGFAHSPSGLKLEFDAENQLLKVDFTHKVSNPNDHFVFKLTVALDKDQIIEQSVALQETDQGGTFVYKIIGLEKNDELTVTVNRNKGGRKRETLVIQ